MKIENSELQTSFEVPDKPTVRDVLRYDGAVDALQGSDLYERLWSGVAVMASDWQSERVALDADLGELHDMGAVDVIKWAGLVVFSHVQQLKRTPKNS